LLKIGDTISLELKSTEKVETYRCKVVDRDDEGRLYIDYPINTQTSKTGFFIEGTHLKASFIGKDTAVYTFNTEVLGRKKRNIPVLVISFPSDENEKISRIQRRQYVRVDTSVDVALHPINKAYTPFTSVTTDISGGGAAIILPPNKLLRPGMEALCMFVLPMDSGEYHYLKIKCKIIRIADMRDSNRKKVPLEFINIQESERQLIMKYCYERQVALRSKGL
jgi:c-di-GMP-binding flagellar brake protein YcgR